MPKMIHPRTGETVEVPETHVERNLSRGFVHAKAEKPVQIIEESYDDDTDTIEEEV